ncbi:MAG: sulfite exporter TauE/SafE family protein [Halocynthiibacter sp.]
MDAAGAMFAEVLGTEGIWLLVVGVVLAGLVRGFSGFGAAMIYLPLAGQVLPPFEALTTLFIMDLFGPLPNLPRALRDGHPDDVARLGLGMILTIPLGVGLLTVIGAEVFRYSVSLLSLGLLVLLIAGVRYHGKLRRRMIYLAGGIGGFLAGSVGVPGPPVIMLYMASPHPPSVIRANTLLFLLLADIAMLAVLGLGGMLVWRAVAIGLMLALPNLLANIAGAAIFRPEYEQSYRAAAYLIIAVAALTGLPLFDGVLG